MIETVTFQQLCAKNRFVYLRNKLIFQNLNILSAERKTIPFFVRNCLKVTISVIFCWKNCSKQRRIFKSEALKFCLLHRPFFFYYNRIIFELRFDYKTKNRITKKKTLGLHLGLQKKTVGLHSGLQKNVGITAGLHGIIIGLHWDYIRITSGLH